MGLLAYELLEREFSIGYNVACNSGTAALHLALEGLRLPKGSQVLVPEFTMVACARAVIMAGLKPVFIDCRDDLNIDATQIAYSINEHTSAIMAVHIYGRRCDVDSLHCCGIPVIEDMSEYHGRLPDARTMAAAYSFYKNKIICGEEGGLVNFKYEEDAEYARKLRSHGFTDQHNFLHLAYGHNYRLSNVHAELILDSLHKSEDNLRKRKEVESWYDKYIPIEFKMPKRDVCWVYDIKVREGTNTAIVQALNKKGIQARLGFKPMSQQIEFMGHYKQLKAYQKSKEILYFPVTPSMEEETVAEYVKMFLQIV